VAHLLTRGERESHCGCGPFVDLLMSPWSDQRSSKSKIKQNLTGLCCKFSIKKEKNPILKNNNKKEGIGAYSQKVQGK
jgi:hypothetical protein